jgi:hypothetical protein
LWRRLIPSLELEMADEVVSEDEHEYSYPSLEDELKMAKAALSAFPEAASLRPEELEAAAGRLVEQSKPENYAKTRLSHDDIWLILALKQDKGKDEATATGREYLESLDSLLGHDASRSAFPEGWLEDRKREHLEMLPLSEKIRDDFAAFQAMVRSDLICKGCVEVDEGYWERRAKMDALFKEEFEHVEEWKQMDLMKRIKIVMPE